MLQRREPLLKKCRELVGRARLRHPDAYEALANELQERVEHERTSHHASALGSVDTFRFEEATVRAAALTALCEADWGTAEKFTAGRTAEHCFWVRRSEPLQRTWEVLRLAAKVGGAISATERALDKCGSLEESVERYAAKLAPVDRDHRVFEQRAHALIASDLEDYKELWDSSGPRGALHLARVGHAAPPSLGGGYRRDLTRPLSPPPRLPSTSSELRRAPSSLRRRPSSSRHQRPRSR